MITMHKPLVSIIIPCYNVEAFVEGAIVAALAQSYTKKEIICIDNGSSDRTLEILMRYEQAGQIHLLQESNKGAPAARNRGLALSKGEWIQFLDADDLLDKDKIAQQVDCLAKAPEACLVIGNYKKQDLDTGKEKLFEANTDLWKGLLQNGLGITSANLFKKEVVAAVGGFDTELRSSQEYDLMFRMLQRNEELVFCRNSSTRIQTRSASISKIDLEGNKHRFLALNARICAYLKSKKPAVYDGLERAYFEEMYQRIRLNTIKGFPQSVEFYHSILPVGFKASERPYDPFWFKSIQALFGFAAADKLQRMIGKFRN